MSGVKITINFLYRSTEYIELDSVILHDIITLGESRSSIHCLWVNDMVSIPKEDYNLIRLHKREREIDNIINSI